MTKHRYLLSQLALPGATLMGLSLAGIALWSGCNTFDPNLGESPFRCGSSTPRCPDGYTCVSYSASEEICERSGADPGRPDARPAPEADARDFTCNNDAEIEPNESLSDPTLTGIPEVQSNIGLVGLAICPVGDDDYFRFDIEVDRTDVIVEVSYQADRGPLRVDILQSGGVSIGGASGLTPVGDPNLLRVAVPNLPIGTYYAHVRSAEDQVLNNYSINISTTQ